MLDKEAILMNLYSLARSSNVIFLSHPSDNSIYNFNRKLSHLIEYIEKGEFDSVTGPLETKVYIPTDTERLDFIEKKTVNITTPECDNEEWNVYSNPWKGSGTDKFAPTLRQSIDAAMRGKDGD